MNCPRCEQWTGTVTLENANSKMRSVIDSRYVHRDNSVRRRRVCPHCAYRFTTYERVAEDDESRAKREPAWQEIE